MNEQLISLETAKLAKEKGFNLNSHAFYGCDNPASGEPGNKLILRTWEDWTNFGKEEESQEGTMVYSAPTQTLLQKWLREKHKIIVLIGFLDFSDDDDYFYSLINHPRELQEDEYYKTYEEALEEGLKHALSLI